MVVVSVTQKGTAAEDARARIVSMIERGMLGPGERLGAERDLALQLGVSRSTLRTALGWLENEGVVRRIPGRSGGTFIAPAKLERDLSRIVGVPELLRQQGFTAGTTIIELSLRACSKDEARLFSLQESDHVFDLTRLRFADGSPLSLERAVLRSDMFPGLPERALVGSLYELLEREYGTLPVKANERIEVIPATPDMAAVLHIGAGEPLLAITRTTQDQAGNVFESSFDLFRADRTRIILRAGEAEGGNHRSIRNDMIEVKNRDARTSA